MKPDWKDAPEWANFMAMDEDGSWYWYEDEPYMSSFNREWRGDDMFEHAFLNDWQLSKERRP